MRTRSRHETCTKLHQIAEISLNPGANVDEGPKTGGHMKIAVIFFCFIGMSAAYANDDSSGMPHVKDKHGDTHVTQNRRPNVQGEGKDDVMLDRERKRDRMKRQSEEEMEDTTIYRNGK